MGWKAWGREGKGWGWGGGEVSIGGVGWWGREEVEFYSIKTPQTQSGIRSHVETC